MLWGYLQQGQVRDLSWARRMALASGVSLLVLAAAGLLASPAQASENALAPDVAASSQPDAGDPWEGTNRRLYAVHSRIDGAALAPAARGYRAVPVPAVVKRRTNALRNLRAPASFANHLLQGNGGQAGKTAAAFALNSTFGLLGVVDVATRSGIETREEDFGQTLAVWGVPDGPFLFVPALGPTTLRDFSGRVVDGVFSPLTWAKGADTGWGRAVVGGTTAMATRESLIDSVEQIEASSIDPYVSYRSNYSLLRSSAIANGAGSVQDLPEFADMEGDDALTPDVAVASVPDPDPPLEPPTAPDPKPE